MKILDVIFHTHIGFLFDLPGGVKLLHFISFDTFGMRNFHKQYVWMVISKVDEDDDGELWTINACKHMCTLRYKTVCIHKQTFATTKRKKK